MKTWQRYWLYAVLTFFSIHLLRDIMQDTGIHNFLSDMLVKQDLSRTPGWYWQVFSTYTFEFTEIFFTGYCLKKKSFGTIGYLTVFVAGLFLTVWSFYWFFL